MYRKNLLFPSTSLLLIITVLNLSVLAFDTGHHHDATKNAMLAENFNEAAIKVTIVENWLTDYYGERPLSYNELAKVKLAAKKLHFDNLFNSMQVEDYWWTLAINTQTAVTTIAANKALDSTEKRIRILSILGITLHAVQDFYTHSNWVELHPVNQNTFHTQTWFDVKNTGGVIPSNLHTGWYMDENDPNLKERQGRQPHTDRIENGRLINGLNKDYYQRPGWDQAYVYAYSASRQWIQAVKSWVISVDPGLWTDIQNLILCKSDTDDLDKDLQASYRISEWLRDPREFLTNEGGHWKGTDSANLPMLHSTYQAWGGKLSRFVNEFVEKQIHKDLITGLYSPRQPFPVPQVSSITLNELAIIIRTHGLEAVIKNDQYGRPISYNMVARINMKIGNGVNEISQEFVESTQRNNSGNNAWPWYSIWFVPQNASPVKIRYRLFNEAQSSKIDDEEMDINSSINFSWLDLNFDPSVTKDETSTGDGSNGKPVRIDYLLTSKRLTYP